MSPQLSSKLKEKVAQKWMAGLTSYLHPGEQVWALAKTNQLSPALDGIAITNARVLGFSGVDVDRKGPKSEVDADDIVSFELVKKMTGKYLVVSTRRQGEVKLGAIHDAEIDFVSHYIQHLSASGFPSDMRETLRSNAAAAAAEAAEAEQKTQARHSRRNDVKIIGGELKDRSWQTIHDHSAPDELPWFIINGGTAGFLAAFEDRLIIAKVGGMAGFMSGSLGGGRITTFPYTDITNIEYNSGMMTGVLEVLTPSYQGTGNHDYWRSTNKSRNQAADDPWTLSNCLPLVKALHKEALPHINEMQSKIAAAKRPNIVVRHEPQPAPAIGVGGGLADELKGLADLHAQGLLDATEFAAAKQAAIAKHAND